MGAYDEHNPEERFVDDEEEMAMGDFSCMVCGGSLCFTPTPLGLSGLQKSIGFMCENEDCPATFQYVALTAEAGKARVVMLNDIRQIVSYHMHGMTEAWRRMKREEGRLN